jgi:hypothetical protein
MGLREEFHALYNRLYKQGHYVVLSAGNNCLFDELFLFEDASNAKTFFESGFLAWESFVEGDEEGCGFQEVSLYQVRTIKAGGGGWDRRSAGGIALFCTPERKRASERGPSLESHNWPRPLNPMLLSFPWNGGTLDCIPRIAHDSVVFKSMVAHHNLNLGPLCAKTRRGQSKRE